MTPCETCGSTDRLFYTNLATGERTYTGCRRCTEDGHKHVWTPPRTVRGCETREVRSRPKRRKGDPEPDDGETPAEWYEVFGEYVFDGFEDEEEE